MQESLNFDGQATQAHGVVYRALERVARVFSLAGGMVLLALIMMSLVSIVGRKLFSVPVRGDMELMEIGAAVAIASFLPLCELRGMHIKADAFTLAAPAAVRRLLDTLAHALCAIVAIVMAWRTSLQMRDTFEYGDMTALLSFPLWIPLLLIIPSLILLALCALNRMWRVATQQEAV